MFKKLMITGCTLILLTACGTNTTKENASTANQLNTTSENNRTTNESGTVKDDSNAQSKTVDITNPTVTMSEALNVFQEAHPDAKIESVHLDADLFGRLRYNINGFDTSKEYETEIDATTKEIKTNEVDTEKDTNESLNFSSIIEPAKALEIASTTAEVSGLSPTGWSLEAESGKQIYTIEYEKNRIDIKINATTEEILEVDIED